MTYNILDLNPNSCRITFELEGGLLHSEAFINTQKDRDFLKSPDHQYPSSIVEEIINFWDNPPISPEVGGDFIEMDPGKEPEGDITQYPTGVKIKGIT